MRCLGEKIEGDVLVDDVVVGFAGEFAESGDHAAGTMLGISVSSACRRWDSRAGIPCPCCNEPAQDDGIHPSAPFALRRSYRAR